MRDRRYLTFDMNNPRHREALHLFSAQSSKHRSEFVIDCILNTLQERRMEEVIRAAISETLADISLPALDNSIGGLRPPHAIEGAESALNRKASQSPHDIFQLAESVIVGNTLPAEVFVLQTFDEQRR